MATPPPVRGIMSRKSHMRNKLRSKHLFRPTSERGLTVEMQISGNKVHTHPQEIAIWKVGCIALAVN